MASLTRDDWNRLLLAFAPTRRLVRSRWRRLALAEVVRAFTTPERIDAYMQTCFEYIHDRLLHDEEDYWQAPNVTFETKRGDCEDYALFAWHVLSHHGYEPEVFAAFTDEDGHAVCLVPDERAIVSISNEGLFHVAPSARRNPSDRIWLAHRAADTIYPKGWTCCSFVQGLTGDHHDGERYRRFHPHFEWIYP